MVNAVDTEKVVWTVRGHSRSRISIRTQPFDVGLVLRGNICIEAAPKLGYMRGWGAGRIEQYCHQRGWQLIR